ncbi:uncharacterized protein LOC141857188 [Brevipalpus obovatus]|uniref:uncharacterized protein LOC141857188 n=1 Tax=Brevipalpus obovatus TaxID=246614 RepID=UPI003D9E0D77
MFLSTVYRLIVILILFETAYSMIITSVYAGRKKFKTFSFDYLLPPIVIEKPNKLQMSYNGHWTLKKPNFRIKFNMPIKLPLQLNYGDNYEEADEHEEDVGQEQDPQYNNVESETGQEESGNYDQEDQYTQQNLDNKYQEQVQEENPIKIHGVPSIQGNINLNPDQQQYHHQNSPTIGQAIYPATAMSSMSPGESVLGDFRKIRVGEKTPYTGKAQVSSFIDNGHLVNAHNQNSIIATKNNPPPGGLMDAAFGDQMDPAHIVSKSNEEHGQTAPAPIFNGAPLAISLPLNSQRIGPTLALIGGSKHGIISREDIRRSKAHTAMKLMALKKMKMIKLPLMAKKIALHDAASKIHTLRLGYKHHPPEASYIATYENTPDAIPLSLPVRSMSKYYSSLSFTNGMHGVPYDPAGPGPLGTIKWLAKLGAKPKLLLPVKAAKMMALKG